MRKLRGALAKEREKETRLGSGGLLTGLVMLNVWIAQNMPILSGHKQFINTKFTQPNMYHNFEA